MSSFALFVKSNLMPKTYEPHTADLLAEKEQKGKEIGNKKFYS